MVLEKSRLHTLHTHISVSSSTSSHHSTEYILHTQSWWSLHKHVWVCVSSLSFFVAFLAIDSRRKREAQGGWGRERMISISLRSWTKQKAVDQCCQCKHKNKFEKIKHFEFIWYFSEAADVTFSFDWPFCYSCSTVLASVFQWKENIRIWHFPFYIFSENLNQTIDAIFFHVFPWNGIKHRYTALVLRRKKYHLRMAFLLLFQLLYFLFRLWAVADASIKYCIAVECVRWFNNRFHTC